MVHLPEGVFRTQGDPSKKIESKIYTVDAFWIGKYEVTFEQFDRFCEETGYYLRRYDGINRPLAPFMRAAIERAAHEAESSPAPEAAEGLLRDYPVIELCWLDAMTYCLWLTKKTGIAFRLPTQAEWEYACMVGGVEPAPPTKKRWTRWLGAESICRRTSPRHKFTRWAGNSPTRRESTTSMATSGNGA